MLHLHKPPKTITYNKSIKVIRQRSGPIRLNENWWKNDADPYYTSFLNDKQYLYSFLTTDAAYKCMDFLKKYKQLNDRYPGLHINHKPVKQCEKTDYGIYVDEQFYWAIKQNCLLNGVSLIGIKSFDYTLIDSFMGKRNIFNLDISAIDLLEDEELEMDQYKGHLNQLFKT
jgi:hypothetical protein